MEWTTTLDVRPVHETLDLGTELASRALQWADVVPEQGAKDSFLAAADWELSKAMLRALADLNQ